jgi:hypothetical protein
MFAITIFFILNKEGQNSGQNKLFPITEVRYNRVRYK